VVLRIAILVIGLVAVYVVFFSGGEEKDMMDETNAMPDAAIEQRVEQPVEQAPAQTGTALSKEQETRQLLEELRAIPVSQFDANLQRYERLLELHPGDDTFARKVDFYSEKLRDKQAGY
jgi:cytochrome bd-type quinol oxidase subunit 1